MHQTDAHTIIIYCFKAQREQVLLETDKLKKIITINQVIRYKSKYAKLYKALIWEQLGFERLFEGD